MVDYRILISNINIFNLDLIDVDSRWSWKNINSPFSRLYYITKGHARLKINDDHFELLPGKMYLVPSYATHDYYCEDFMQHYFVHFTCKIQTGLEILDIYKVDNEIDALPDDTKLFSRLLELNPNRKLNDLNPRLNPLNQLRDAKSVPNILYIDDPGKELSDMFESQGILRILISRFLKTAHKNETSQKLFAIKRFEPVLNYIDMNISEKLTLEELAQIVHLNPTYFSNTFYKLFGERPVSFVNRKRIENAQSLLVLSNKTLKEIAVQTGFDDVNYFSRVFSKYTGQPPMKYRNTHSTL